MIANEALELPKTAKTLRFEDGWRAPVTDGPFAETKEQLGGFCLIDCASLDEAIEWAKKVPLDPAARSRCGRSRTSPRTAMKTSGSVRIESSAPRARSCARSPRA